ncbi:MAG: PEP-CTERM sorting domain-containing protein [Akkermansiaceae bacterium]
MKNTLIIAPIALMSLGSVQGAAVVYEGFDYNGSIASGGNIAGANGGTGFSGAWVNTRNSPDYVEPGNTAGTLTVVGGKAQGGAWSGIARPVVGTLSSLLTDTSTLWFSLIMDLEGQNQSNADINVALTNAAKFNSGTFGSRENLDGATNEGIGVTHSGGNIRAVYWDNAGGRTESGATSLSIGGANPASALVVGKIEWGAATETITLYAPDAALNLGTAITSLTTAGNLSQAGFNNLAIQFKDQSRVDELRFGATSDDVLGIPEPSSTALLGLGGLALILRRRK